MKKIVKLTEQDLENIVKKVLSEQGSMFGIASTETPGYREKKRERNVNVSTPLHISAAIEFIKKRKDVLTEKNLTNKNIETLSEILCEKSIRLGSCNPSLWGGKDLRGKDNKNYLGYNDFSTSYSKSPSFGKKNFTYSEQPTFIHEVMLTFGQANVQSTGGGWVVTDNYDFKNILDTKPYLKTDSNSKIVLNTLRGVGLAFAGPLAGKSPVHGIEEVLSQMHNTGYPGYPVKINIPKNGCKCKP